MWPRCSATVEVREGGGGGGGTGLQGSLEREGGPRKRGLRKWTGLPAGEPSTDPQGRGLWDSPGRRKGAPLCVERSHNPGRLAMGPYLLDGGRTAVCCSSPILIERVYCGMVEEAISRTGLLRGEGPEGLCWGGCAQGRIYGVCLEPGFGYTVTPRPQNSAEHWGWCSAYVLTQDSADVLGEPGS